MLYNSSNDEIMNVAQGHDFQEVSQKKTSEVRASKSDRPWFDLTKVWRDQTRDLPGEEMFSKVSPPCVTF